jgi:uncharacterized membrane protein YjjP (DUF1212 family)
MSASQAVHASADRSPRDTHAYANTGDLLLSIATLLFENGQTTERTNAAVEELGASLGVEAALFPQWGELIVRIDEPGGHENHVVGSMPAQIDMRKVADTMRVVDAVHEARLDMTAARREVAAIARLPPVSTIRFASFAAAGAVALAVIFGAAHWLTLVLIALSAFAGACLRRWLGARSHNLLVQPLSAALLSGLIGAAAVHLQFSSVLRLVAVCPCMVLVPGPHILNGVLDLAHGRMQLGQARLWFASLVILMICTGLLAGLWIAQSTLPVSGPSTPVPFVFDVLAAGVAVAAYGTFFAMRWRDLAIPVVIGMLAHACRWALLARTGASVETATFVACLVVGLIATPVAHRLRLPFAGLAFASVVSMVPGVFVFRMASGLERAVSLGSASAPQLLDSAIADGCTALLLVAAMAFGLIIPKLGIEHFWPRFFKR